MMTESEFRQAAEDVFDELLPKVKPGSRKRFIVELIAELADRGLDLEQDEDSSEDSDDLELDFE